MKTILKYSRIISIGSIWICGAAMAQTLDLKGRVLDKVNMLPVVGATVKVTGESLTALTRVDGRFSLKAGPSGIQSGFKSVPQSPFIQGSDLIVTAISKSQSVRLEFCGLSGQGISVSEYRLPNVGLNKLAIQNWPQANFFGFARITTSGATSIQRILHLVGQPAMPWSPIHVSASHPLSKTMAAGSVDVTMDKLLPKTAPFTADVSDLGDIVLDYPTRTKIGVGANIPYGATLLFDGTKGKAAATAEIKSKWQDWLPEVSTDEKAKYTAATNTWRIMPDPQFPTDTNHVTLQSCCDTVWGYDDLQSKIVHGDAQLHVEFTCMGEYDQTENTNGSDAFTPGSKGYCNSGVYIQSRYEVQINSSSLDTNAKPNVNNTWMAAIVGDRIPTANPNRMNGEWQSYDITFRTARYNAGATANAKISLWWNGKLVHDNVESTAPATGTGPKAHSGEPLNATLYGLKLQNEGRDVRFRNVWIKPLTLTEAKTGIGY